MIKEYARIKYTGLSFCTNGNVDPFRKINVYFSCHPTDFDKYFGPIKNDIWTIFPELAFWYNDQVTELASPELLLEDISQMNLIIVPITKRFIEEDNISRTLILPYAVEHHIAVLPLLLEHGIEDKFNSSCGNLQYVQKLSDTYKYTESLRVYLDSVLVNKDLQKKIKAEFSLHLFISYRKKDKEHIYQIQKRVHNDKKLRDAAIWYDDYLVPGERFDNNISKMIEQCDAFIILITPNLLEKDNYVMNYEYPLAIRKCKRIIPIQVVETDKDKLLHYYKNIPDAINLYEINDNFSNIVQKAGIYLPSVADSAQHLFLMGNAYLSGIEVESDFNRAIDLISEAANNGYIEAYKKLISIYRDGCFDIKNPSKVVYWEEQYMLSLLRKNADKSLEMFYHLRNSGDAYSKIQEYNYALEKYDLAFTIANSLTKKSGNNINFDTIEEWQCLSDIYLKKGKTYDKLGLLEKAEKCFKESLKIDSKLDENEETTSHKTMRSLAVSFVTIGEYYLRHNELIKAKHVFKHAIQLLDPSNHYEAWMPSNKDDEVYFVHSELEAVKGDYFYLEYSYEALAKIATARLQIHGALFNYRKAQTPAYKLYKVDKTKDTMLRLIEINLWILYIDDHIVKINRSDEAVVEEFYIIEEIIKQHCSLYLLMPLSELEKIVMYTLEIVDFEEPIEKEKKITRQDIQDYIERFK